MADRPLPPGVKYYFATVFGKEEGYGPIDVLTRNTVESTQYILKYAEEQCSGFKGGNVVWVEQSGEPPADLVADFWAKQDQLDQERVEA